MAATLKQGGQGVPPNAPQPGVQPAPMSGHSQEPQIPYGEPSPSVAVHPTPPDAAGAGAAIAHAPTSVVTSVAGAAAGSSSLGSEKEDEAVGAQNDSQNGKLISDDVDTPLDSTDAQADSIDAGPVESAAEQSTQSSVTEEQEVQSETKPEAQRQESPKVSPEPEAKPESDAKSELGTVVNSVPPPKSKDSMPEPEHSHDTSVQEPVPPPSISTAISQLPAESEGVGPAADESSVERVKESSVERSLNMESSPVVSSAVLPTTQEPAEHIEPSKPENGYPESGSEENGKFLLVLFIQFTQVVTYC